MGASRCCLEPWTAAAGLLLASVSARAADSQAQVELISTLTSENLLAHEPPSEPALAKEPSLLDRWRSPRSGQESRARFELEATEAGFLPSVETSARLRLELEFEDAAFEGLQLRDIGSWLAIAWRAAADVTIRLKAFPIDTDYRRLGYLHALDWGGTDASRGESIFVDQRGKVPGAELQFATSRVALFAGLRWATAPINASSRHLWGVTFGGELALSRQLHAGFGLGYFQRTEAARGPLAPATFVEGASLRLVWRSGLAEPDLSPEPLRPGSFRDDEQGLLTSERLGSAVALEAVTLATRLRRFEAPESRALVPAPAAAAYASSRSRTLAGHAAVIWRSLAFVQRNDPGIFPGQSMPRAAQELGELSAWLGASATWTAGRLTPSLELGLVNPAALVVESVLPGVAQTLVAREGRGVVALPIGSGRLPVAVARLALRFQPSRTTALIGFGDYERDPNRVRLRAGEVGPRRVFAAPDQLKASLALQARF